jgi:outer membrane protein assembly factor BamA
LLLGCLFLLPAFAWNQDSPANVQSSSIVEAIDLPARIEDRLSSGLRQDLRQLVGVEYDESRLDQLLSRLKDEVKDYRLVARTIAGSVPGRIRVVFDALVQEAVFDATNINSRYTVEGVDLPAKFEERVSDTLRSEMKNLVGARFSQQQADQLTRKLKKELAGYRIHQRITRGSKPDAIRIVFDIERSRRSPDLVLPRLAYHSKQNFTFGSDFTFGDDGNEFRAGILTDNNETIERYSGFRGGYYRVLLEGRLKIGFMGETWRSQWNPAVEAALASQSEPGGQDSVPAIYRKRQHISPNVELALGPVTVTAGVSLQRFQTQFPAARYETANALISSLRLEQRWQVPGLGTHNLDAGYHLRAATRSLNSDFSYTRHTFDAYYQFEHGKEAVAAGFTAGYLAGRAPLFERFVLGNANTLRGWNKFDVAPLGGSRMAHGTLDYRHHWFRLVYDVGSVHGPGAAAADGAGPKVRHSLAAGLTTGARRDALSFLVAFPLRDGRAEPIFILGMNF